MLTMNVSQQDVDKALDVAVAEGYEEILSWTAYEVALDLTAFDTFFKSYAGREEELIPFVITALKQRATK